MTKLGPKVRLFMTPIPTIGFCDAVCAALAIAREAHSNTHFRAKVAQDSGGVTKLGPKVCLFLRRYLKLGFAILCAQSVLKHSV